MTETGLQKQQIKRQANKSALTNGVYIAIHQMETPLNYSFYMVTFILASLCVCYFFHACCTIFPPVNLCSGYSTGGVSNGGL